MADDRIAGVISRIHPPPEGGGRRAHERWQNLTKPEGSLGRLEELGERLALLQGTDRPRIRGKAIVVFAADHGVTAEGVSAYPKEVTRAMVENFLNGGAAINVLARLTGASLHVVDMGIDGPPLPARPGFHSSRVAPGTRNFSKERAMSGDEVRRAVGAGMDVAETALGPDVSLLAIGDMGIGNTTSASALIAALTGAPAREVVGRGTGITEEALERKRRLVENALAKHGLRTDHPWEAMEAVGGLEIAGIAGATLLAASKGIPVVVDGLISTSAALWAATVAPRVRDYLLPSHMSVEKGHRVALQALGLRPYLDLEMRLGEGTGASLQFTLCEAACRLLDEMATFEEAAVARRPMM